MKDLIIDDDLILREQLKEKLLQSHIQIYQIDEATTKKEAEKKLVNTNYDLVACLIPRY